MLLLLLLLWLLTVIMTGQSFCFYPLPDEMTIMDGYIDPLEIKPLIETEFDPTDLERENQRENSRGLKDYLDVTTKAKYVFSSLLPIREHVEIKAYIYEL